MIASYSEYLKKQQMLSSGGDFSPEAIAKVQSALDEYKAKYLNGGADLGQVPLKPAEYNAVKSQDTGNLPSQEQIAQELPQQDLGGRLVSLLDPMSPLVPQALAVQPATTHPEGDEAAKNEWVRGDLSNPAGRVIVYDTPISEIRKDLLANPELGRALGMAPDSVMRIQKGDSIEQRYNDYKWRETADAAAKGGKTAYRYSKAPYLGDGKGAGVLDSLSTKLKSAALPGIEGVTAFVMGLDDTANFGIAGAVSDAGLLDDEKPPPLTPEEEASGKWDYHPTLGKIPKDSRKKAVAGSKRMGAGNDEYVGGSASYSAGMTTREQNDSLKEDNPGLYTGGQLGGVAPGLVGGALEAGVRGAEKVAAKGAETKVGNTARQGIQALSEWGPANALWDTVMGKPSGTLGGMASTVARSAAAGGVSQGVTEGARAGANYAATGDTGTTLREAGGRIAGAAEGAAGFGTVSALTHGFGGKVRDSDGFYGGLPGDVEKLNGGKVYPIVGHATPKAVTEARAAARAREMPVAPIDVFAENLKKPLTDAAKAHEAGVRQQVGSENSAFMGTPEGRKLLPAKELAGSALGQLRERSASIRGAAPTPVGTPGADKPVKGIFNANIEGVSVRPVEGWIPVPVNEAAAFLSPSMKLRGVRAARNPGRPIMRAGAGERAAAAAEESSTALDRRGYRANPVDRLPSGEVTALAKVERTRGPGNEPPRRLGTSGARYQDEGPQHEPFLDPKYPGAPHPELGASDTRFQGAPRYDIEPTREAGSVARGSRAATAGERAGATGARAHETGPRGEPPPGPKAPGIRAEPAPDHEPASIPDAQYTQRVKRAKFKPKDAPSRTSRAEPTTAEGKARQSATEPRAFIAEMKRRGVDTVYVAPRRYNAMHQESAIRQVRRKGGETVNDRDLQKLHHAALRDRDARPMNGEAGGWSKMQQGHERDIRAAKETRKLAAPNERGAYDAVIGLATPKAGQSEHLRALSDTADRAGGNALEQLRGARVMEPLTRLQRTSGFGKAANRMRFGPSAMADMAVLRGLYPMTRALEGTHLGKLSRVGGDAEADKRRHARDEENRAQAPAKPASKSTDTHRKPGRRIERKAK